MERASRSRAPAVKLSVGARCSVPARHADKNFSHLGALDAKILRVDDNVDLHFAIDSSVVTVSRGQALKWLCDQGSSRGQYTAPAAAPPAKKRAAPAAAAPAPPAKKKPKANTERAAPTAAVAAPPAKRKPKASAAAKSPSSVASPQPLLPICEGSWTSPLADAGGGGRTGSFEPIIDASVTPPHTLLLGTQPATNSLGRCWYFGSDANAFWHIVGHALRFRRGFHDNERADGDVVPSIAQYLRDNPRDEVLHEYEDAVVRLQTAGYALWDFLRSSVRKDKKTGKDSSLDSNITKAKTADIEGLVARHPSIRRLVFVTGKVSANMFGKEFKDWLARGQFCCGNESARTIQSFKGLPAKGDPGMADSAIELIVPPSVSPAANRFPGEQNFGQKRDGWMRDVFV